MSEWGLVAFYYDYERKKEFREKHEEAGETKRVQGLVAKAYKFPGTYKMILHAYYGTMYFLRHIKDRSVDFSMPGSCLWSKRDALNTAFDVFFDYGHIDTGVDTVKNVMDGWQENEESCNDDEKLGNDLFNCEGSDGWFFVRYIGGELKYGYSCRGELLDVRGAIKAEEERSKSKIEDPETLELLQQVEVFFKDNGTLFSFEDEFWDMEKYGADCVREAMKEPEDDPFRDSFKDGAFTIKLNKRRK